ncbi:MAG TPA: ribosome maturation factor RimM, partial [Nakamurella sp.]
MTIAPATDDPDARFAVGNRLSTDPASRGPLTVTGFRRSGRILVLAFDGFADRDAAETLRGVALTV